MEDAIPGYYVTLENVFGTMGMILWSFQLAPQGKNEINFNHLIFFIVIS